MAAKKRARPAKRKTALRPAARVKPKPPAAPPKPIKPPKFTAAEAKAIRKSLLEEQERLQRAIREQADEEMGDAGAVGDVVDAAASAATQYLTLGLTAAEARTLKEVREALARLDADTYGVCRRCAGGVERERLEAIPWAPTCIACRREEERLEHSKEPRPRTAPAADFNPES